jgi:predicted nucleotidyltransferase
MTRKRVLEIIADHRAELTSEFGVASLALFGSVARDEATSASDVDVLVEFDGRPVGLFHLSRTQQHLETVLGVPRVDLVLRDAVKPALRDEILREAVYAM